MTTTTTIMTTTTATTIMTTTTATTIMTTTTMTTVMTMTITTTIMTTTTTTMTAITTTSSWPPTRGIGSSWGARGRSACTPIWARTARSSPTSRRRTAPRPSRSCTTSVRTSGNLAFEVGDPGLDAETTLGLDLSLRHRAERVRGDLNVYVYEIDNFIFGERTGAVADGLPVLDFQQGDSRFVGWDARGSVRLGTQAWTTLGIGYVNARLTTTDEPLPRIPPLRATWSLDLPYGGFTVSPELEFARAQNRLFPGETETGGYSVVNLRASYVWPRQHAAHILTFTGYNLTNALYRNHTSFIKDLAPEMGRGIKAGYSVRFF